MGILRTSTKIKDTKLIGAVVPPHIHQYLTLYVLAKGTTKATLFKELIESWMAEQRKTETDDVLVKMLIARIADQWYEEKSKMTFENFKAIVKLEMEDKGLKASYVNVVLSQMTSANGFEK